jgi:proteic killer suppression protein
MIRSYRHKGLKRLAESGDRSLLRQDLVSRIENILSALDRAPTIEAMNHPSLRLHALRGDLKGFWAVTVRANWRIVFRFAKGDAFDVDLIDYH